MKPILCVSDCTLAASHQSENTMDKGSSSKVYYGKVRRESLVVTLEKTNQVCLALDHKLF